MQNEWPILTTPPVDVALFQLKFDFGQSTLADFTRFDSIISSEFPIKRESFSAEFNFPNSRFPLGIAQVTGTSKTKVAGYLYMSTDQKSKIEIREGIFTYIEEHPYQGWGVFAQNVRKYIEVFKESFDNHLITRISIRFINRFVLDDFSDPLKYFKTTISASDPNAVPYPVGKYAFNLVIPVNDSTYSIVKQEFDKVSEKTNYIFDIDVLNQSNLIFDVDSILAVLSDLRKVKNDIFFGNVTDKLIELCN
jgi:uncharacterized protein (TIGR04255 family)